jgi:hypothetical protein
MTKFQLPGVVDPPTACEPRQDKALLPSRRAMAGSNPNGGSWSIGGWRKPKELEARNIVLDDIYPSESLDDERCGRTKIALLSAAALVVVVVAVVLGVVLSQDDAPVPPSPPAGPVGPSSSPPVVTQRPTGVPSSPATLPPVSGSTSNPTLSLTNGPTVALATEQFIRGLPRYSLELISNTSSPQAKALDWLQKDPQYNEYELYRLNQRYALAVLYYATNGASWNISSGWLSNASECEWYQFNDSASYDDSVCRESSRLTLFDATSNNLGGTIPTELELLTDLEILEFYNDSATLSVAIYPELYVITRAPVPRCCTGFLP